MKQYILLALAILIACQTPVTKTNLTTSDVLEEFTKIDAELNTNWHEEQIPDNMIRPDAIEPWTAKMIFLKDRLAQQNNTIAEKLVNARLDMLKSQLAYYASARIGEKGKIDFVEENGLKPSEIINCSDVKLIAKSLGLYNTAYIAWTNFTLHMDEVMQKDVEIREKIGTGEKKPKFYETQFPHALKLIEASTKAVYDQCQVEIIIQDKMEDPLSGVTQS